MCFDFFSSQQQQQPQQYYMPYEVPYFAAPGGGFSREPQYPLASQLYQDRFNSGQGGYGLSNDLSGMGTDTTGSASSLLGVRPTTNSGIATIGSDAHMGSVPGASQMLGAGERANQSPISGWF